MRWNDVRASHPDQWLVIEALSAHTPDRRRIFDQIAVIEVCADGATAFRRYREPRRELAGREVCFVHTGCEDLDIQERHWMGIRVSDATHHPR